MILIDEFVLLEANFTEGFNKNPFPDIVEVGAVRVLKGTVINKYESLVGLDNLQNRQPSCWADHGINIVEMQVAPSWHKVNAEIMEFCHEAKLIGWSGSSTMYVVQKSLEYTRKAEGLYWAYQLDLRSYLSAICGELLSRDCKQVFSRRGLSIQGIQRPLVRCQRLLQLINLMEDEKHEVGPGKEAYEIFEF